MPAATSTPQRDPGSFRDPASRIVLRDGEVFRGLSAEGLSDFELLAGTRLFRDATASGALVATEPASSAERRALGEKFAGVLRHERVPFISYPYEWSFEMLRDAALLTLDLLGRALDEGLIMKDASAYNVQFRGAQPTFIDVGSFERLRPGEPWFGYRQFCEMFLYPLMLQAYKDIPFHPWLRGSIEGISPDEARQVLRGDKRRKGVLKHVVLHAKLQSSYADTTKSTEVRNELKQAGFKTELVKANVAGLTKLTRGLEWRAARSEWSDYRTDNSYTDDDTAAKAEFVAKVCAAKPLRQVWDLGANDGRFSRIALESAQTVLAIDSDHLTVDRLYRTLRADGERRILPLVMDLASPSPGLGWRGAERRGFTDRGRPDLTLALAVVHHLAITRNIPLGEVTGWLAELGGELVIEFPTRDDPQVKRLLRNKREGLHDDYDVAPFERALESRFRTLHREVLPSQTRVLYHARPSR